MEILPRKNEDDLKMKEFCESIHSYASSNVGLSKSYKSIPIREVPILELLFHRIPYTAITEPITGTSSDSYQSLLALKEKDILLLLKYADGSDFCKKVNLQIIIKGKNPIMMISFSHYTFEVVFVNVFLEDPSTYDITSIAKLLKRLLTMHLTIKEDVFCLSTDEFCEYIVECGDSGSAFRVYVNQHMLTDHIENIVSTISCKKIVLKNQSTKSKIFSATDAIDIFCAIRTLFPVLNITFEQHQNFNVLSKREIVLDEDVNKTSKMSCSKKKMVCVKGPDLSCIDRCRESHKTKNLDPDANISIYHKNLSSIDDEAIFPNKISPKSNRQHSGGHKKKCSLKPSLIYSGFNTASGNKITISKSSVNSAKVLIEDTDNTRTISGAVPPVVNKITAPKFDLGYMETIENLSDHGITLNKMNRSELVSFKTGLGNTIRISKGALASVNQKFSDIIENELVPVSVGDDESNSYSDVLVGDENDDQIISDFFSGPKSKSLNSTNVDKSKLCRNEAAEFVDTVASVTKLETEICSSNISNSNAGLSSLQMVSPKLDISFDGDHTYAQKLETNLKRNVDGNEAIAKEVYRTKPFFEVPPKLDIFIDGDHTYAHKLETNLKQNENEVIAREVLKIKHFFDVMNSYSEIDRERAIDSICRSDGIKWDKVYALN